MKTLLGEKNEVAILAELEPIIKKFARRTRHKEKYVRTAVAYLWECEKREAEEAWDKYLSANEIGPYGGR